MRSLYSVSVGGMIYGCPLSLTSVHTTAVCVERGLQGLRTLPQTLFMVSLPTAQALVPNGFKCLIMTMSSFDNFTLAE